MTLAVLHPRDRVTWDKARAMGMEKCGEYLKNVKLRALGGKEWEEDTQVVANWTAESRLGAGLGGQGLT